jgi:hypothetical protein
MDSPEDQLGLDIARHGPRLLVRLSTTQHTGWLATTEDNNGQERGKPYLRAATMEPR